MRILHLSQFHAPVIGGEERHVVSLSEGLAARGHEVAVATLAHPDRPPVLVRNGVTIRSLTGLAQRGAFLFSEPERRHAPPFPDPELTVRLAGLVREFQPDVVHGHNWMLHAFLPLKRRSGPRLVATLHDYSLVCARKNMLRFGEEVCTGPSARRCLPCAADHFGALVGGVTCVGNWLSGVYERRAVDRFIAVSRAVAATCGLDHSGRPYEVLPTFIPDAVASLDPEPDPRLAGLPPDGYLLFVGDLTRGKGVHILLDAYRRLADAPPLVLIGRRCPDTPTELPDNVRLFESWPHAAVMHAWSRCLFGIAPSVWAEACGTIVMEGHAVGRPMIATDTGGLRDLVAPGETGLLVPPGDAVALAEAMRTLIADRALRERMAAASPARARLFMASTLVPRIERVYADVLAEAAAPVSRLPAATREAA